jgi:PAS domain S-box-containing protein
VAHRPFDESPQVSVLVPGEGGDEHIERAIAHFVDSSSDLLAITGLDGRVKWVNAAHETLLGYKAEELIDKPYFEGFDKTPFEVRLQTRDGSLRRFLFSVTPSAEEQLRYSVGRDVTEERRLEEQVLLARELASEIGEAGTDERALEVTLRRVCAQTGWALGQAWVRTSDGRLGCSGAWHSTSDRFAAFRRLSESSVFPPGLGLPGRALASREPVWLHDVTAGGEYSRGPSAKEAGLGAGVAVPVIADDVVVAVLEFFLERPGDQDEELVGLASAAARQLGAAMREEHSHRRDERDLADERRRAEEAVQEAEERFRSAFEKAPIGIGLVSIEADRAGCFLRINQALAEITGYAERELIGSELGDLIDPAGADKADRHYVPWMLAGELSNYESETRLRHADGQLLDVLVNASLVRDAHGRPLYLIVQLQNVTARKEAERKLGETSRNMQAILDNTTAVAYLKDTEGRYVLVNRGFEALFGVSRDEAVGRDDATLFAPELAELLRANDLRVLREQIPLELEEVIPVGDRARTYLSTKFPLLDSSRRPYAVCGISTDITERKLAEEALRASEQHFRGIVNTAHEAFVSMDEAGRITAWNPAAETTFGWSEDEAIGRSLGETIIPPRHRGAHLRGIQQFLTSGHAALLDRRLDIEALHRDGHEFPVEMTITAVRVGGRYRFNSFLHDISERKQAEQALRRLADIIEASGDAIFATTPGGEITSWNAGAEQLYGYSAEEAVGAALKMLVAPDNATQDFEALKLALNGTRLHDYETEQLRKDGTLVPVSLAVSPIRGSSGALVGASVIARDRTKRKRAEEALREVQEAFRTAFEDAPIGMALFSVDPAEDGQLLQVNGSLCDITGYSADELLRTSLHAITHPLDQMDELALTEDLLAGRVPNYQLEKRFVRRDERAVWVMHNVSTVHDAAGGPMYGIAQVQDITERKRAEEGLARVAAELEQRALELERSNADLAQFAYVASHDLSEPLRMVSSYVQLLERRYGDQLDSDAREFIEFAVDGVNRMQRLIDDLLAYSRVGTSEYRLEPVDLAALVEDTLKGMRATVSESEAVVTHDGLPTVVGDPGQLRQLFQNLISNGIKFVDEGLPRIHVSATRDGREWLFAVADNGIGIDPSHASRIFAVFKRLHGRDAYPGSGIGLSICKRIVERHQGRIWVEQNEGGGSRFCFTIPAMEEIPGRGRTDVGSHRPARLSTKN